MKRPLLANNTRGLFQKANFSLYRTQSQRIIYIHHYGAPSAFSRKRKFHLFHIFNSTINLTRDTGKPFDNTNLKSSNGINQQFKIDINRYTSIYLATISILNQLLRWSHCITVSAVKREYKKFTRIIYFDYD